MATAGTRRDVLVVRDRGRRGRAVALGVSCLCVFVTNVSTTVLTGVFPALRLEFHATLGDLEWIADAYLITLAALYLPAGAAADRYGPRRVLRCGLSVFAAGSLLCGLAPSIGWLIGWRVLQAVGASILNPVALAVLRSAYPSAGARARAFGIWGAALGTGMALGPLGGVVITEETGWRWAFLAALPLAATAWLLCGRSFPADPAPSDGPVDVRAQLLLVILVCALTVSTVEAPMAGVRSPVVVAGLSAMVVAAGGLALHARRRMGSLIDPRDFRGDFGRASLLAFCSFFAVGGVLFLNTLYLHRGRGLSLLAAAGYPLPMAGSVVVTALLSSRAIAAWGIRRCLLLAGAATAAGGAAFALGLAEQHDAALFSAYAALGVGSGLATAPITEAGIRGMPAERAGVASATLATVRQVGQSLGVALAGTLLAAGLSASRGGCSEAIRPAFAMIACCGVVIAAVGLLAGDTAVRTRGGGVS